MPRVALYARISEDPNDTRLGVERQREDCRALAERRGWEVAGEYVDNDVSAYRRRIKRPQFEEMLADLEAQEVDGVVVYDLDRLARQPRDLERLIDIYEDLPLVFASAEGDIDLQSSSGRTLARVMTAFANKSSADTGRRVARKHLELAQAGKPVGTRVFGWKNHTDLHPEESRVALEGVELLLGGASVASVCRHFNEQGFRTVRGNDWAHAAMLYYYRNPRLAGMRVHKGEIVLNESREPVSGAWTPLIDVPTWERLQTLVRKPDRRSRVPRRGARHYLLTGMLTCGVCGGPMYGGGRGNGRGHVYSCAKSGHNSMTGSHVDQFVSDLAIAALHEMDLGNAEPEKWQGEQRMSEISEKISELMDLYARGEMSASVVLPTVQRLEEEQREMQKDRAQWLNATGPVSEQISHDEWESLDVVGKRLVVDSLMTAVVVRPSASKRKVVDLERIEPVWRQGQP